MALIRNKINDLTKKPETYRQNFVRINGWTHPFHWLQIIAWFFLLLMCLIFYTFIVPTLPNYQIRCTVVVIQVIILIFHIITHLVAVNINPADDNVVEKLDKFKDKSTNFDRTKHSHVIENQFCYICETTVGPKSKHCSVCNKCVSDFDHHCKWLNNCVGGKNYRWFIYCVLSALIGITIVFVNCLILTIAYFSEKSWLFDKESTLLFFNNGSKFNANLQIFWIAVIISSLILSLIAFLLLTHLLGFHLFLNCVGLSTYEFVVQQRKRNSSDPNISNESKTNKLVSYLNRLQKSTAIEFCTKKRVKPLEVNQKTDLNAKDKQLMASVFKSESDIKQKTPEKGKSRQNSDMERDIEECGKQKDIETKDTKQKSPEKKSPAKEENQNQFAIKKESQLFKQFKEVIENEKKPFDLNTELKTDLKTDSNQVMIRENTKENKSSEVLHQNLNRRKSNSELLTQNEPIFMPLNPSFGQNGRMSRLSFTNRKDFIVPSLSPDFSLKPSQDLISDPGLGLINPNHVFVGYNNYNKLIENSIRFNPLNHRLDKINKIQSNNRNKLEINSSNDLTIIENNITNKI